ncbi:MAG: hypothetical protein AABY04_03560, partial [Candidatus Micrarchaeota archaeon]
MEERKKYRAIDPNRKILESPKIIRSVWGGRIILRGSRVIKDMDFMDPRRASELQYTHKIAKVALKDLNCEVLQYRIIKAS